MKLLSLCVALCASFAFAAESEVDLTSSAKIYVQAVGSSSINPLAEVQYNPTTFDAEIASYEPPEIEDDSELIRLGVYDSKKKTWSSSVSVTSAQSFSKGYAPILVLSLDANGDIIGVSCQSAKVDAGFSRDFGPKAKIVGTIKGKTPELNRPVVLKDGKLEEEVPEKTLFQKYWWVGAAALVLMVAGGGDGNIPCFFPQPSQEISIATRSAFGRLDAMLTKWIEQMKGLDVIEKLFGFSGIVLLVYVISTYPAAGN